jgi:hypothetical protein
VLNWPFVAYKFTLGVGTLAVAGMLAELWRPHLPVWLMGVLAVAPFAVFILIRPGELPDRVVRFAHVAAAVWYLTSGVVLIAAHAALMPAGAALPFWLVFAGAGAVPCVLVVWRAWRGRPDPGIGESPGSSSRA